VLLVHVAILAALLASGRVQVAGISEAPAIETFDVVEAKPPPPPPQLPPTTRPRQQEGQASAPNLKSEATPVVAPEPVVSLPPVSPVVATDTPALGSAPTRGAAPMLGPGTGAGGVGTGTGAGGSGNGPGGGGVGGIATGPRQIAGSISRRDYPRELEGSVVAQQVVRLQYTVGADGLVHDCRILQSSGAPLLDQRTCQLYEQRYRYEPARDAAGRPVPITVRAVRSWFRRGGLF
jgi:protein TonB